MSFGQGLEEFVKSNEQKDHGTGLFELESDAMLEINVDGTVMTKMGAMVAYTGDITFKKESAFAGGLGKMFKKAFTGEVSPLVEATGKGKLYVTDYKKKVTVIKLNNETINVQGNDLLAFEKTVNYDIKMMKSIAGMLGGGLFSVLLEGSGHVAFTSHGKPLTLRTSAANPVRTDPNATVAWSGNQMPELKKDIGLKNLLGRGGGESFQMNFSQDGFVVVQPYEEVYVMGR